MGKEGSAKSANTKVLRMDQCGGEDFRTPVLYRDWESGLVLLEDSLKEQAPRALSCRGYINIHTTEQPFE